MVTRSQATTHDARRPQAADVRQRGPESAASAVGSRAKRQGILLAIASLAWWALRKRRPDLARRIPTVGAPLSAGADAISELRKSIKSDTWRPAGTSRER